MAVGGGVIAALVGAAGAVGLVMWSRKRAAATQPAGSSDRCAALAGNAEAYAACKAASAAWDIVAGIGDAITPPSPQETIADRANNHNVALNGPVVERLPSGLASCTGAVSGGNAKAAWLGHTTDGQQPPLRYANGCVPILPIRHRAADGTHTALRPGAAGSEKCVPGTQTIFFGERPDGGAHRTNMSTPGPYDESDERFQSHPIYSDATWLGNKEDPLTAVYRPSYAKCKFPLPLTNGQTGYYVRGKPMVCNRDQVLSTFFPGDKRLFTGEPRCVKRDGSDFFPTGNNRPPPPVSTVPSGTAPGGDHRETPYEACLKVLPSMFCQGLK